MQTVVASTSMFSPTERTVIALAFTSPGECEDCRPRSWPARILDQAISALVPEQRFRPLANPRLDALRRVACAIRAGMAEGGIFDDAMAAGVTQEQISVLRSLAFSPRSRGLTEARG